jgi:hypothetical protein
MAKRKRCARMPSRMITRLTRYSSRWRTYGCVERTRQGRLLHVGARVCIAPEHSDIRALQDNIGTVVGFERLFDGVHYFKVQINDWTKAAADAGFRYPVLRIHARDLAR